MEEEQEVDAHWRAAGNAYVNNAAFEARNFNQEAVRRLEPVVAQWDDAEHVDIVQAASMREVDYERGFKAGFELGLKYNREFVV